MNTAISSVNPQGLSTAPSVNTNNKKNDLQTTKTFEPITYSAPVQNQPISKNEINHIPVSKHDSNYQTGVKIGAAVGALVDNLAFPVLGNLLGPIIGGAIGNNETNPQPASLKKSAEIAATIDAIFSSIIFLSGTAASLTTGLATIASGALLLAGTSISLGFGLGGGALVGIGCAIVGGGTLLSALAAGAKIALAAGISAIGTAASNALQAKK